jgi:hypothetical protein
MRTSENATYSWLRTLDRTVAGRSQRITGRRPPLSGAPGGASSAGSGVASAGGDAPTGAEVGISYGSPVP